MPSPGWDETATVPPTTAADARMLTIPGPSAPASGSKPSPSSWIRTRTTPSSSGSTVTWTAQASLWRHTLCSASWTICSTTVSVTQSSTRSGCTDTPRCGLSPSPYTEAKWAAMGVRSRSSDRRSPAGERMAIMRSRSESAWRPSSPRTSTDASVTSGDPPAGS